MRAPAVAELTDATFDGWVRASGTPVVVDFWAEWCPPCRIIARSLADLAGEYSGRLGFAALDTDTNPQVTRRYRVMSMPTLLILRDGEVVATIVGARPKAMLRDEFDRALARPPRAGAVAEG